MVKHVRKNRAKHAYSLHPPIPVSSIFPKVKSDHPYMKSHATSCNKSKWNRIGRAGRICD